MSLSSCQQELAKAQAVRKERPTVKKNVPGRGWKSTVERDQEFEGTDYIG